MKGLAADVPCQSTSSSSPNDVGSDGPVALLVEINVDESDAGAMRFYERHGFSNGDPDTGEQAFWFHRSLDAGG